MQVKEIFMPSPNISLNLDPTNVVGGISTRATNGLFREVSPRKPLIDKDSGFRLDEFEHDGMVIGLLTTLLPESTTPAWHIKRDPETFGYSEASAVIEGSGTLAVKGAVDDHSRSGWIADANGVLRFDVRSAMRNLEAGNNFNVKPGEIFQLRAGQYGLMVLTIFPGKPFDLSFEERTASILP
jgi:hypothetical protein